MSIQRTNAAAGACVNKAHDSKTSADGALMIKHCLAAKPSKDVASTAGREVESWVADGGRDRPAL